MMMMMMMMMMVMMILDRPTGLDDDQQDGDPHENH